MVSFGHWEDLFLTQMPSFIALVLSRVGLIGCIESLLNQHVRLQQQSNVP